MHCFLIGAQKAGTTSFAEMIGQHPDICVSQPKETHFFSTTFDNGFDWYLDTFADPKARILFDASTSYSMNHIFDVDAVKRDRPVAQRIFDFEPHAKFVYILRDPAARTYSSYWHSVRAGSETRPFREAVTNSAHYLAPSHYHKQLAYFSELFPSDSFLLLDFADMRNETVAMCHRVFDFLLLPACEVLSENASPRNQSFQYNGLGKECELL